MVHADAGKVAKDMEDLINTVKTHTKKTAVSSIIKRYDVRVQNSKISDCNSLLEKLCIKNKITFIKF